MKLTRKIKSLLFAIVLSAGISGTCLIQGCGSTPVTVAVNTERATIPIVNAAMFAWKDWVVAGNATQAQVDAVKDAYNKYLLAQYTASNACVAYFTTAASSTNTAQVALETFLKTATTSQTQLLALIASFQKGK